MVMDKDFILSVEQTDPWSARALIERIDAQESKIGEKSIALQVTFCEQAVELADAMAMDLVTYIYICSAIARSFVHDCGLTNFSLFVLALTC
jgi:hypothetical protein